MSESKLRALMRKWYGNRCLWVEHAPGGTPGYPDLTLMSDIGKDIFMIELKYGKIDLQAPDPSQPSEYTGFWKPTLRLSQKKVFRNAYIYGQIIFVVIMDADDRIWACTGDQALDHPSGARVISFPNSIDGKNQLTIWMTKVKEAWIHQWALDLEKAKII